ncbi:peptidylprolyl isomerase [Couchioplanes azureus]|uniref:peptidylprolyl isomerase n=1 Tax=Couchioplanes caeruleus TaxID=56438 RepID=UPI00167052F5|nr:peptidylprolyl isomerase [Couchioplanes caeruleus]GGQ53889.1 putative peptidyl-prolyl cis-trans isomerase [Couchioplanes caeruleus subsp. azureus]
MVSSKDRARKLAREKLDRQLARRAAKQRRRRQIQAGVGAAAALLLVVGGVAWLGGAFDSDKSGTDAADSDVCAWTRQNASTNTSLKDVGEPPTSGIPTSGSRTMTITTDKGAPIVVSLDLVNAPCSAADLAYLAGKKFYDNTTCHELTTEGAIRCGDPSGTGQGGPTYSVYNENVPLKPEPEPRPSGSPAPSKAPAAPLYPKGTVALIGDPPGTNGSQFLIFFKDFTPKGEPQYPIVGTVTGGMETVAAIGKIPVVANATGDKVKPKEKITVQSVTVGEPSAADPVTPPAVTPSAVAAPSAAPSASRRS